MRMLIAEDDATMRHAIAQLFEAEGFECLSSADGLEALQTFRTHQPDFCIIDVMMPGLDGFELCRKIRGENDQVPVLMLTARQDEIDRVVGLELGADDYVTKPFGSRELVARVRTILRRAASPQTPVGRGATNFRIGDVEVDVKAQRGYRGAAQIDLTRREIAILSTLQRRAGQVVSRDDLFDQGWGRDYMPNSRALDQCILTLRRKIEKDPQRPTIIQTVHGAGYRYEDDGQPDP